jgi:hypothetical protein
MKSTLGLSIICLLFLGLATALSIPTHSLEGASQTPKMFQQGTPTTVTELELKQQERLLLSSMLLTNRLSFDQKVRLVSELKRLDQRFSRDSIFRYSVDTHDFEKRP